MTAASQVSALGKEEPMRAELGRHRPVVVYHHIKDGYKRGMTPEQFERQFLAIKDTHVLSFDDGLKEGYTVAFPLLRKHGKAGYFSVIGETLEGQVNHIHKGHILLDRFEEKLIDLWNAHSPHVRFDGVLGDRGKYRFDSREIAGFKKFLSAVDVGLKNSVFDAIMREHDIVMEADGFYITKPELREMSDAGMVIGNHTLTHPCLSGMEYRDQEDEIVSTHRLLRRATDGDITMFSYPYGTYDGATLEILRKLGYDLGFTTGSPLEIGRMDCRDVKMDDQKRITKGYFDSVVEEYHDKYEFDPSALECMNIILGMVERISSERMLKCSYKMSILDMGCGAGNISEKLARNHHVTGVDLSEKMINFARKQSKSDAVYLVGDIETFDTQERFDIAIAKGVFEYLDDDEKAMKNIRRLLKHNGHLIAEFRHANFIEGDPNYVDPYPMKRRVHSPAELKVSAEGFGFKVKETVFYHHHKGLKYPEAASAFVSLFQREATR